MALLMALSSGAAASALELSLERCPAIDEEQTRRILDIELRAYLTHHQSGPTRVWVGCSGSNAHIQVNDESTHKSTSRVVDLSGVAELAKPRALALAAAELIAWSWTELVFLDRRMAPVAPSPPAASSNDGPSSQATATRQPATSWALFADARIPLALGRPLWGGGAVVAWAWRRPWYLAADVQGHGGSARISRGRSELLAADLRVAFGVSTHFGQTALHADFGTRLGVLRYEGVADDAQSFEARTLTGLWAGPSAAAGLRWLGSSPLAVGLTTELGYALFSPRGAAPGATVLDLAGPWVGLRLGLGAT